MPSQPSTIPASLIGFFFGSRIILLVVCVRLFGWDARTATTLMLALNYFSLAVAVAQPGDARGLLSRLWQPPARWALAFIVLSGASLLWTVADSTASACAFWLAMVSDSLGVLLLLHKGPAQPQASALMRGYVYGVCVVALVAWMLPSQSDLRLGDEELLGPNQIGFACATALFFAQFQLRRSHQAALRLAFALLLLTLLRSLSKTTIVAYFVAQAVLLAWDRSVTRRRRIGLSLAGILVLAAFMRLFFAYADVYLSLGNQSLTLSGRLSIWAYIFEEALSAPWLGHGFHSVWKVIPPMNGDFEVRHAHNELLQQFYAYGAVGVALVIAYYASFLRSIRRTAGPQRTFMFCVLLFVVLRGLTDTEAFDLSLPCWAMLLWSTLLKEPAAEPASVRIMPVSAAAAPSLQMSSDCHL